MLRYSEASGPIARVTRCLGVPALKMFVLDDVNLCKTVACKIDVEHSRFHASRVRRSRMATQHDGVRELQGSTLESDAGRLACCPCIVLFVRSPSNNLL